MKNQQHTRLKVSFAIHDCATSSDCSQLVNLAAILKSPLSLIDIFLKAVIRTKVPLSFDQFEERYHQSIQHIQLDAQLTQITQQHLSQWPKILFAQNPLDSGVPLQQCVEQLLKANPELSLAEEEVPEFQDSFFH